jgi:hypothetical protein
VVTAAGVDVLVDVDAGVEVVVAATVDDSLVVVAWLEPLLLHAAATRSSARAEKADRRTRS